MYVPKRKVAPLLLRRLLPAKPCHSNLLDFKGDDACIEAGHRSQTDGLPKTKNIFKTRNGVQYTIPPCNWLGAGRLTSSLPSSMIEDTLAEAADPDQAWEHCPTPKLTVKFASRVMGIVTDKSNRRPAIEQ